MKSLKIGTIVALVILVFAALAAPLGPLPGFWINGTASDVPESWGNTLPIHEIRLQVGDGPIGRTVTIWMVQIDDELFVVGDANSRWTRGIGAGGPVRVAIKSSLYELTATPVEAGKAQVISAWVKKYEQDYPDIVAGLSQDDRVRSAAVFRLTARTPG